MTSTSRGDSTSGASAPVASAGASPEKSYFEVQREAMCHEIAISLENVLQNMNKLNRALEGVIAVGNEFSSVEALWSQFENVMGQGQGQGQEQRQEDDVEAEKAGEGIR